MVKYLFLILRKNVFLRLRKKLRATCMVIVLPPWDLVPVFSFNSAGVFAGIAGGESAAAGGTGRLSRWEDLLRRAKAEGFD